jgi:hypothetical protein
MDVSSSPLHDRLVFLVGTQRSGTNWVQRLLATHPDVVALPSETQLFAIGIDVLAQRVQHGVLGSPSTASVFMDRDAFHAAARAFCDTAFAGVADRLAPSARRIVERSPNHVENLELIGAIYPDAWIVHLVRDGRDVARSLVSQPWGPRSVSDAAALWAGSIRSARTAAATLARYREIRYEDLLENPADGLGELFRFLGLEAGATTIAAVLAEAGVPYNTDQRRPEIGDGKWRSEWSSRELAEFERVAGDLRQELGYASASATGSRAAARLRAARRRVRRLRAAPPPAQPTRPYLVMEARQRRVDQLCAALAVADPASAEPLLAEDCVVRVVTAQGDERARSAEGRSLLGKLIADEGEWGEQLRGDVHVSPTVWSVVLTHDVGGQRRDRMVVVQFRPDDQIAALTIYGCPL